MTRKLASMATMMAVTGILCAGAVVSTVSVQAAAQDKPKMVPPLRGTAQISMLKPKVDRVKDMVVTKLSIKNMSNAPVVGLKVDEFWYDKGGNTLPADSQRLRKPLQPGEVVEITLNTPSNKAMFSNKYNFSHSNGDVKVTQVASFDPKPGTN